MVVCLENGWRYYGESSNVSGRIASHKSVLKNQIHANKALQRDWNTYGPDLFEDHVIHMGPEWEDPAVRRAEEMRLIASNPEFTYNVLDGNLKPGEKNPFFGRTHSEATKKSIGDAMRNRPNDKLGKSVSIHGVIYPSYAEASRKTGHSRKLIRQRVNDPTYVDWYPVAKP